MHDATPLVQNATPAEQAMMLCTIVSFAVAWAVAYSAQEGIRRHLPADFREGASYRYAIDSFAFAVTTPRPLMKRYLLGRALMFVPCLCGLTTCVIFFDDTAIAVCLIFLVLLVVDLSRSWLRYSRATGPTGPTRFD